MGKTLVIVESPAKARTISRFLGEDYVVESSIGHIRDLPKRADEVPAAIKKEPWGRLAIDVSEDFQPYYVVPKEKRKQVSKLKELLKGADALFLATDEDREGESISWHLCEVLKPKIPSKRLVFHEITREAIQNALLNTRDIDERLVRAQETRRILDRLFGFEISPVLWRKIAPRLSAGRVQSVAVRSIIERERARIRFVPASYWDLVASFNGTKPDAGPGFPLSMQLVGVDGKRLASGRDFSEDGQLKSNPNDVVVLDEENAGALLEKLRSADFEVGKVESKPYTERPSPPFTTSTLQQEANRKLRFSTRVTMQVAQRLYENGYITYMRTDSTTLSDQAVRQARELIGRHYGQEYLPDKPRAYKTKVKNAQEAHEAIRPAGESFRRPEELKNEINSDELKIYELIWKRTVASQMENSRGHRVTIQVQGGGATFQATGKTIDFPGFLRAYVEGADDPQAELADKETILPTVLVGDPMELAKAESKDHKTQPPPRFTEASLVKELEANGVGRPSTYASIIDTIIHREYVVKQGTTLIPTFTAFAVVGLLEKNFGRLVDTGFTASMEDDLDAISRGEQDPLPYLKNFYFGGGENAGLKDLTLAEIDARETCTLPLGKDDEGREINIRIGRYGPFIERGEDRASVPADMPPDALDIAVAIELLKQGPAELGVCPETQETVYFKSGRYGPYVQRGDNDDEPKMKSVPKNMDAAAIDLGTALALLALPRSLGNDPESGDEVFADYGRYGAYLKRGSENRSFKESDDVLTIELARALQIFKETPARGKGGKAKPEPIKELGVDKESGNEIKVMKGRFGPYVTDGDINASVPRGGNPEEVTLTEALELLKARAARLAEGGGTRKKKKKASKKKAAKKTTKAAKKATSSAKKATKTKKAAKKKTAKKKAATDE
jgi:DNA topoisomerase-1